MIDKDIFTLYKNMIQSKDTKVILLLFLDIFKLHNLFKPSYYYLQYFILLL